MNEVTCKPQGLESSITVGQVFELHCSGSFPLQFKVGQAVLSGLKDKYSLKLLKFELRDVKSADLQLTSYRVGPQKFENLIISDGETNLELPGLQFEVKSVLPPAEGATEPPKPFGPIGPIQLATPWVYWIILASVIGIAILLLGWSWKKRRDRKEILTLIKNRTTGPTPIVQFHRDLRILTRKAGVHDSQDVIQMPAQDYLKELRLVGETFWGQKFKLALLGQSTSQFEKEFKNYAPKVFVKYKNELRFWNNRWQRLNATSKNAKMQDFIDMTLDTRNLIEKMVEEES
jgi:hypothetical protein